MKRIITNGIIYLEPLAGSSEWYWAPTMPAEIYTRRRSCSAAAIPSG